MVSPMVRFFEKLNRPRSLVVVLALFFVVNAPLLYLYQRQFDEPLGTRSAGSSGLDDSFGFATVGTFGPALATRHASSTGSDVTGARDAGEAEDRTGGAPDGEEQGGSEVSGSGTATVPVSLPTRQQPTDEAAAGATPAARTASAAVVAGRWAVVEALQTAAEAVWQRTTGALGTTLGWLLGSAQHDDSPSASSAAYEGDGDSSSVSSGASASSAAYEDTTPSSSSGASTSGAAYEGDGDSSSASSGTGGAGTAGENAEGTSQILPNKEQPKQPQQKGEQPEQQAGGERTNQQQDKAQQQGEKQQQQGEQQQGEQQQGEQQQGEQQQGEKQQQQGEQQQGEKQQGEQQQQQGENQKK